MVMLERISPGLEEIASFPGVMSNNGSQPPGIQASLAWRNGQPLTEEAPQSDS